MDLAHPAWKGRIGASTGGADFQAIVSAMLEFKGEDATRAWLEAAKTNFKSYKDDTPVLAAVNSGEIEAGVPVPLLLLRGPGPDWRKQQEC